MAEVRISEHGFAVLENAALTDKDRAVLDLLDREGVLSLRPDRTGWRVSANSYVGLVRLDTMSLTIGPKLAFGLDRLMDWYLYATVPSLRPQNLHRGWHSTRSGFADLLLAALMGACKDLLRAGLRRDYLGSELVDTTLRGRIDVRRQLSRRYGQIDQIHQLAVTQTSMIWENAVCGVALRHAAALCTSQVRGEAQALSRHFGGERLDRREARNLLRLAGYHRMNQRYRLAHAWARLILNGYGLTEFLADGPWPAGVLLIDMDRLWEQTVERLVAEAVDPVPVEPKPPYLVSVTESGMRRRGLLPDIVVNGRTALGNKALVIDAKYKAYGDRALGAGDTHQMLTYAAAVAGSEVPEGVILFPSPGGSTSRLVKVGASSRALGHIEVIGVDTSAGPEHAVAGLRQRLLRRLAVS